MRSTSSSQSLDVHSSPQSNHDVSLHPNSNANDDIIIGFIYSSDDLVPVAVQLYSYSFTSSIENYIKPQPLSRRRDRTSRRAARRRRRPQRRRRTRQSSGPRTGPTPNVDAARYHIRLSSQNVDAVYRARNAVRRSLNLSDGELVESGASIGFATI